MRGSIFEIGPAGIGPEFCLIVNWPRRPEARARSVAMSFAMPLLPVALDHVEVVHANCPQ